MIIVKKMHLAWSRDYGTTRYEIFSMEYLEYPNLYRVSRLFITNNKTHKVTMRDLKIEIIDTIIPLDIKL